MDCEATMDGGHSAGGVLSPVAASSTRSQAISTILSLINEFEVSLPVELPHVSRTQWRDSSSPSVLRGFSPFTDLRSGLVLKELQRRKLTIQRKRKNPTTLSPGGGKSEGKLAKTSHIDTTAYGYQASKLSNESRFSGRETFTFLPKVLFADTAKVSLPRDTIRHLQHTALQRFSPLRSEDYRRKEQFRASVNKLTKREIQESRKRRVEQHLEEKFRKHDWRVRAEEISEVKKRWAGIVCYVGSLHTVSRRLSLRKVSATQSLHIRSAQVLKFLLLISLSVGKIVILLKRSRLNHAITTFNKAIPYFRRWIERRKQHLRETVAEAIERSLSADVFYSIIVNWKRKVVALQRCIKHWLERRRAYKAFLLQSWSVMERKTEEKGPKYSESTPERVKMVLIHDLLKQKLKDYIEEVEQWKSVCESLSEAHKGLMYEVIDGPGPQLVLPGKPRFPLFLSPEDLQVLTSKAEKRRHRWHEIPRHARYRANPS